MDLTFGAEEEGFRLGARAVRCGLDSRRVLASGPRARQLTAAAFDCAALGTAAQLVGLAARTIELTLARSIVRGDPERSLHVSMAKSFASEAALLAARKALQLHGAIGYSYEYDLHLVMKRSWALAAAYGDALEHRKRIADVAFATEGETHG